MKILHLSTAREFTPGQRKQLSYERAAARKCPDFEWTTVALHTSGESNDFDAAIPPVFRAMFLRNLYGWIYMLRVHERYDYVLCRHFTFDPFVLVFGWFIPNRITVHHAKEVEELRLIKGWKGGLASSLERITGAVNARQVHAVLGVTQDIRKYQVARSDKVKRSFIYPNGISTDEVQLLPDERDPCAVCAAFICGEFQSWHGLDKLIEAVEQQPALADANKLKIYLIGSLSKAQRKAIAGVNRISNVFIDCGTLPFSEYAPLLAKCDLGLGSFALERKNLEEAATLKIREYLALGLPVYSGHKDTAIPDGFAFYKYEQVNLANMIEFARKNKTMARSEIRAQSKIYIEKSKMMQSVVQWLSCG